MVQPSWWSCFARVGLPLVVAGLLALPNDRVWAQTSFDEVHVTPRAPAEVTKNSLMAGELDTHTRPLKVSVNLVLVPVTITDAMERLVVGLAKENFEVFEGRQQQEIRHFSSQDMPVSLGVVLDVSSSMKSKIERAREAVMEFLKTANPQDEFFLITFADRPEELEDFTQSIEEIQARLPFTVPKGRTSLLDAIYLGISKMRKATNQRKALLIISDGGDNHSRYSEGEIKRVVEEADVLIYAIGTYDTYFKTTEELHGPELLTKIAETTGGRSFVLDNPNVLPDVARLVGKALRNQYVLGYRPSDATPNEKWRKIRVKLLPPKGLPPLRVYAKHGYYASSK